MKTNMTKQKSYYYDISCQEFRYSIPKNENEFPEIVGTCDGNIDANGKCEKCGTQSQKYEYMTEHGTVWYQVSARNHDGSAQFSIVVDGEVDNEEYNRKLISALRRLGCRLNGVWMDGCKQQDGYDGHYGNYMDQKMGGGFSVHGRFSVERI